MLALSSSASCDLGKSPILTGTVGTLILVTPFFPDLSMNRKCVPELMPSHVPTAITSYLLISTVNPILLFWLVHLFVILCPWFSERKTRLREHLPFCGHLACWDGAGCRQKELCRLALETPKSRGENLQGQVRVWVFVRLFCLEILNTNN